MLDKVLLWVLVVSITVLATAVVRISQDTFWVPVAAVAGICVALSAGVMYIASLRN